jgi:hypothetical protein
VFFQNPYRISCLFSSNVGSYNSKLSTSDLCILVPPMIGRSSESLLTDFSKFASNSRGFPFRIDFRSR